MVNLLNAILKQLEDALDRVAWGAMVGLIITVLLVGFFAVFYLLTKTHIAIAAVLFWIVVAYYMGGKVRPKKEAGSDLHDEEPGKSSYSRR